MTIFIEKEPSIAILWLVWWQKARLARCICQHKVIGSHFDIYIFCFTATAKKTPLPSGWNFQACCPLLAGGVKWVNSRLEPLQIIIFQRTTVQLTVFFLNSVHTKSTQVFHVITRCDTQFCFEFIKHMIMLQICFPCLLLHTLDTSVQDTIY